MLQGFQGVLSEKVPIIERTSFIIKLALTKFLGLRPNPDAAIPRAQRRGFGDSLGLAYQAKTFLRKNV